MAYGVLAAMLFFLAFMTKRRIGAPILGLAAGYVLSSLWAEDVLAWVLERDVASDSVLLGGLVPVVIAVLPALVLMVHGHFHKSTFQRLLSAGGFTLVALAFLHEPIQRLVVADEATLRLSGFFESYGSIIVAVGLVAAIVDLVFTRLHKTADKKAKH